MLFRDEIKIVTRFTYMTRHGGFAFNDSRGCGRYRIHSANRTRYVERFIKVLAHEIIHCEQYDTGRLLDDFWDGVDHSGMRYPTQPWEVQAMKWEKVLFDAWKQRGNISYMTRLRLQQRMDDCKPPKQ